MKINCLILFLFLNFTEICNAEDFTRNFSDAVKYYKEENYKASITEFSKITEKGIKNYKLFYNLGNAYLKNGDIGNSILWYKKAEKLNPHDPDLKFNLKYALSLAKDQKEEEGLDFTRIFFFWKFLFSEYAIQLIAVCFNILFWLLLFFRLLNGGRLFRVFSIASAVFIIIFFSTALYNYYEKNFIKQGVILNSQVLVKSGISQDSTTLFNLHAGTLVLIEKENNDFIKIQFSEDKIGWIKKTEAGII